MPAKNPFLTHELRRVLEAECKLYVSYNAALAAERDMLRKLKRNDDTAALQLLIAKRAEMVEWMKRLQEKRIAVLKDFPNAASTRLSDLISTNFHPIEVMELKPLVTKLKLEIERSKVASLEFSQVVSFAQGVLNGLLGIFHSATQCVLKSYSQKGGARESYHPSRSRSERVIKQA